MGYFKALILSVFLILVDTPPSAGWTTVVLRHDVFMQQISLDANHDQPWDKALNYAQENLPMKGQLIVKSDGFGYLKVDDAYIHTLFPLLELEEDGFKLPPYFRSEEAPGAHISVFYVHENIIPEEVDQFFHFTLKQIVIVKPSNDASYAVLQVESPELEKLREKYGLSPKLFGHDYHISLAKKTHLSTIDITSN